MPGFTFNIVCGVNEGLVMSPTELVNLYLQGIPLCFPDGRSFDISVIKQKILSAQRQIENFLSIKLIKQIIDGERRDYIAEEYKSWGYIKSIYPINEPFQLQGMLNDVKQIIFSKGWLSVKKPTNTGNMRNLYVLPNAGDGSVTSQNAYALTFGTSAPGLGYFGSGFIPNYWSLTYVTGLDVIPMELIDVVGKIAAIQVLAMLGDILLGVGISSTSLSLDGLSQSISNTKSAQGGIFAGRIKLYGEQLIEDLKQLKAQYRAIMFNVL